jgi:hypothetical protein
MVILKRVLAQCVLAGLVMTTICVLGEVVPICCWLVVVVSRSDSMIYLLVVLFASKLLGAVLVAVVCVPIWGRHDGVPDFVTLIMSDVT